MEPGIIGYQIRIKGIVQGVGFRPHVYRLAQEFNLNGWVLNSSAGVFIEVEGEPGQVQAFALRLIEAPPPLALIRSCETVQIEYQGFEGFEIRESENQDEMVAMVSPDIAICPDCRQEVTDRHDRRYGYPFINCTNCGPRFTIIKDLPYDRAMTTMADFPMCPQCQAEYEDPLHRRFHAQPNACPVCGPQTVLLDRGGKVVQLNPAELLKKGAIIAVKGLGAFHLAVDVTNAEAVFKLRQRKRRDAKAFAVMARDIQAAAKYCYISELERTWLTSPQAPIVVMQKKEGTSLSEPAIHPGLSTLGVMLPYTPLHFLLFDADLDVLIMTSANVSDEPLITDNQDALNNLGTLADYFLLHNRDIYNPCDDSVMTITPLNTPQFFRRARGLVPRGIPLPVQAAPVLALGGEMKNTFCMTRQGEAFLSQHWGDLNHYQNYVKFQQGIERFARMLAVEPRIIAHDLHPNYQTTRWAKQQDLPRVEIQHHYAHLAAVMAECGLEEEVLGLVCDGTGWGTDGAVWGCEVLRGDLSQYQRLAHLQYRDLPGGDITARKPYRMAWVYLLAALDEVGACNAAHLLPSLGQEEMGLLLQRWHKGIPEIKTSSCGRLFDAVAALLGICEVNNYEGQAAMQLEACADRHETGHYGFEVVRGDSCIEMDVLPMLREIVGDIDRGVESGVIAQKFHLTLAELFLQTLCRLRDGTGLNRVVLSGGVFHNQILLLQLVKRLEAHGFMVFQHQLVPPGDGGIALGQALIASEVIA